jgi:hypothetical protein
MAINVGAGTEARIGADDGAADGPDGGVGGRRSVGMDVGLVEATRTRKHVGVDGGENVGADGNVDDSEDNDDAHRVDDGADDGSARRR